MSNPFPINPTRFSPVNIREHLTPSKRSAQRTYFSFLWAGPNTVPRSGNTWCCSSSAWCCSVSGRCRPSPSWTETSSSAPGRPARRLYSERQRLLGARPTLLWPRRQTARKSRTPKTTVSNPSRPSNCILL